ncbi:hypothetical protein ACFQFC_02105 [Amorphoplanes digitatis]|uniref:Uncharacterized protein n=1 Tax=Actinoplanes digitatis TaxID=1868 RepID=A0A7W7HY86_9ACTN|nr:hypothetical protein [Actinoplanes digitatis]MBB4762970.1 hypothetical protein [Actinoplanes digitatis]BFE71936.1 hypothetical protein GCM10020092_052370 [Actinoplanes digitatis]GID95828.1 hypothetical protein Adi01nite_52400 [Actinoplanes digitatis]
MIDTTLFAPPPIRGVDFDDAARRLLAARPGDGVLDLYAGPAPRAAGLCLHVTPTAPAGPVLMVFGEPGGVLRAHYRPVPYAISAVLLALGEATGRRIRCGFAWPPGLPRALAAVFGVGGTAAEVRALLRRAEPDRCRRPVVHLGD